MANSFQTTNETFQEYLPAVSFILAESPTLNGYHTLTQTVAEYPRGDHGRP